MTVITLVREIQLPLLALILLGACTAKLARTLQTGSVAAGLGPTDLFPRRLKRPAAAAICSSELIMGPGLLLTAGRFGGDAVADLIRVVTCLFFVVALCGLVELREHRPDLGCGCFGDLSVRPVGIRSILRAGLLAVAAAATVGLPPVQLPPPGLRAAIALGLLVGELLLVAVLSPETGEVLTRLGYSEPCELREASPRRALAALHRSRRWRRQSVLVDGDEPADMWRELCWWYVVYPVRGRTPGSMLVFAVQAKTHRPAIRSALAGPYSDPRHGADGEGGATSAVRSAVF
ncbi:MAG TPA: MauE/DoxX family redox-associated membrane protein [Streptosporangiaceae bacterium]